MSNGAAKILVSLLMPACALLAQTVEGTAVDATSGQGLYGVTVTLSAGRGGDSETAVETTTDAQGEFRFENVKAGTCRIWYRLDGFLPSADNAAGNREFRVVSGSGPIRLRAELTPLGKISGRVLDLQKAPMGGAMVEIGPSQANPANGGRRRQAGTTDRTGRFSFGDLPPGAYTLSARAPVTLKPPPAPEDGQRLQWAPTFYPGVLRREEATPILVWPGAEVPDEDIKLIAAPARRIRGVVIDERGEPAPGITVELYEIDRGGTPTAHSVSAKDGSFEIPAVTDGEWRLMVHSVYGGGTLCAFRRVQVTGRDLENVQLQLATPFTVKGSVSFDVPDGSSREAPRGIVTMGDIENNGAGGFGPLDNTGSFSIPDLTPGTYAVHILIYSTTSFPFYLDSIRLGERDALTGPVEVVSGALPLRILYKADGGTLRGSVEECASSTVLLTPRDARLRRPEISRKTTCDQNGRYEIPGVRPGDYYALALESDDSALTGTDLDQSLIGQAVEVTVRAGVASHADLRVIARPGS